MVAILKEFKRNAKGQQWFDVEVFYTEKDAMSFMVEKVKRLIQDGFTVKTSEKHHQYLLDEEHGDEFEYMVEGKLIHGESVKHPEHEDIPFSMNQIISNGWESRWLEREMADNLITISKRFESQDGELYFIHMDMESMKMVYIIDEARKRNEELGFFEISAVWEPNEIVLIDEKSEEVKIHHDAFERHKQLIKKEDKEEMIKTYEKTRGLWYKVMGVELNRYLSEES